MHSWMYEFESQILLGGRFSGLSDIRFLFYVHKYLFLLQERLYCFEKINVSMLQESKDTSLFAQVNSL